jgi:hypothetical protein
MTSLRKALQRGEVKKDAVMAGPAEGRDPAIQRFAKALFRSGWMRGSSPAWALERFSLTPTHAPLVPAKAGIQGLSAVSPLGPRLRGDERKRLIHRHRNRRLDGRRSLSVVVLREGGAPSTPQSFEWNNRRQWILDRPPVRGLRINSGRSFRGAGWKPANPESSHDCRTYAAGFRVRRCAAPRNDEFCKALACADDDDRVVVRRPYLGAHGVFARA